MTAICFVAMFGCSSLISCCLLSSVMLLISDSCHSCFDCHLQTVHPIPVIFISISTEIISSIQRHTWFAKIMPGSSFPSGACICIAYHISHIMPCSCVGCLPCCLLVSGLFLSLASVSFRSCEDPFDFVRLSSSWTRSSSLRDFRQDDHTLEITSIFAC